ncbi:NAD(P)-dependent oxidoreductase [Paraburkholderia sartisoli]|uniref:3-hydroxyisobutyrate dehydrogenase n=1 Tax=Paraburkholderia sartisoli TaxID=83784 RepID=A0A1H4GT46_9BURK|nr:NAD(P)-dependent oxidoreductase [Paraburkholderia sartisoli]SEB12220.1 3-hydroxyisobutyrate dehydrogenase [Paraburkholderia sartisoli]
MSRLAWIGFGRIGKPMALRLIKAGHEVSLWDIDPAQIQSVTDQRACATPAAAVRDVEAVFLCVPDAHAVDHVLFGDDGVATSARPGTFIVDHSTLHPDLAREFETRAGALGLRYLDAPVSGGAQVAEDGRLSVWIGGDAANVEQVSVWIRSFANRIEHMGSCGLGQLAKSCNQAIVCSTVAAWAETLRYAKKSGLDPLRVVESLSGSGADSSIRRNFAADIANGLFPALSARNMIKDLRALLDLAEQAGCEMPMAQEALAAFKDGFRIA